MHRENGFFIVGDGWEYNFILAIVATAVAVVGAGTLSLDAAIGLGALSTASTASGQDRGNEVGIRMRI